MEAIEPLSLEELVREAGLENASPAAISHMNEVVKSYALYLAKYAAEIARTSGRKAVEENDVRMAFMNASFGAMKIGLGVG